MTAWIDEAACRGMDREAFFPPGTLLTATAQEALATCGRCPVRAECLAYAVDTGSSGIWGGKLLRTHSSQARATPIVTRCARCGRGIATSRASQRYCSDACRHNDHAATKRAISGASRG